MFSIFYIHTLVSICLPRLKDDMVKCRQDYQECYDKLLDRQKFACTIEVPSLSDPQYALNSLHAETYAHSMQYMFYTAPAGRTRKSWLT